MTEGNYSQLGGSSPDDVTGDKKIDIFFAHQIFLHLWMGIILIFILIPPTVFSTIPKSRQKGKSTNFGNCYVMLMHSIQERPGKEPRELFLYRDSMEPCEGCNCICLVGKKDANNTMK